MTQVGNVDRIMNEFENIVKESLFLAEEKNAAFETFKHLGFPTTRHEEWKYTSVKKLVSRNLEFSPSGMISRLNSEIVNKHKMAGDNALVLVFENGNFNEVLSDVLPSGENITIGSIAAESGNPTLKKYLGKVAAYGTETFVALNTAFLNDGLFVHVPANNKFNRPLHFMHFNTHTSEEMVCTVRNLVVAEKQSSINIIESFHSINENGRGFTNAVSEIVVGENARVDLVKAQVESDHTSHISFTQVIQEKNSTFDTVTVTLSGELVRNNLHILHNDTNCTSHLFGLYVLDGEQLVDNHTLVDHAKPYCFSNELYKGILGGKSSGIFNGKIMVRKDAQKTNAYQSNKNILLSDDAQVNTKPQLEIFADDVKCTHGATTGQLDDEALFYMRTRGIGEKTAKTLLNIAFAGDVLNNIKNEPLRENLFNLSVEKLHRNED